jgi:hypothetical protein
MLAFCSTVIYHEFPPLEIASFSRVSKLFFVITPFRTHTFFQKGAIRAMSWIEANNAYNSTTHNSMSQESFEIWLAGQSGKNETKIGNSEEFSKSLQSLMKTGILLSILRTSYF